MFLHGALDNGKTVSVSVCLCCLEGFEEVLFKEILGNALAVVAEGNGNVPIVRVEADIEFSLILHCLDGVFDQIEKNVLEMLIVGLDDGEFFRMVD